jgi:hypothetical protein
LTEVRDSTREDFFDLIDNNQDGIISVNEYEFLYSLIDADGDVILSHKEIKNYVNSHLDSICAEWRSEIIMNFGTKVTMSP